MLSLDLTSLKVNYLNRNEATYPEVASGHKFLATILVAESSQERIIGQYITELTGTSLQSPEEVMRTAKALGIDTSLVQIDSKKLKEIFDVRNRIIHELDINLEDNKFWIPLKSVTYYKRF